MHWNSDEQQNLERLFVMVTHLYHHRARKLLHDTGLHRGQPAIMRILWQKDGIRQKDIADYLHRKPATITKMINRLEKAGFVQRQPDKEDMRVSRIFLTTEGRSKHQEVQETLNTLDEQLFDHFSMEERIIMRRLLLQMVDNLQPDCD